MQIGFIVILIIAIFVAIFAIQNGTPVPLDLFLARFEMPLAVVMMVCIILGAIIVLVLGTTRQFKKRSESKELKNKLKTLESDKVLSDNKIKAMETEIQTIKDSNSSLSAKISELEGKNKLQRETIEIQNKELVSLKAEKSSLNNELDSIKAESNALIETISTDEGAGTEIYDEKSEAQSE